MRALGNAILGLCAVLSTGAILSIAAVFWIAYFNPTPPALRAATTQPQPKDTSILFKRKAQ